MKRAPAQRLSLPLSQRIVASVGDQVEAMERAYARFVPEGFLKLMGASTILDVGIGDEVERSLTVMFSDIRSFTALSEKLAPSEVFQFINSYLGVMVPVIESHGGVIDKYIGDAIMGLFPRSADDAVSGATSMLRALSVYNAGRTRAGYPEVGIGIGLNTGFVMLGTIGGPGRLENTVLGDAVNVAARLESLTRQLEASLLITETTLYALSKPDSYAHRFVDRLRVKGRSRPLSVYEVFEADETATRTRKSETREIFERAAAMYHSKRMNEAFELFTSIDDSRDPLIRVYLNRCESFRTTGHFAGTGELERQVAWDDAWNIGVPEVDAQHRVLLVNINQLVAALRQGDTGGTDAALTFLERYATEHFALEDRLMVENSYPFIVEHRREHARFVDYFRSLKREISSGSVDPWVLLFRIDLFLIDWLVNHTTSTDLHLGRYITRASGLLDQKG